MNWHWILRYILLLLIVYFLYLLSINNKQNTIKVNFIGRKILDNLQITKYVLGLFIIFFFESLIEVFSNINVKLILSGISAILIIIFAIMYVLESVYSSNFRIRLMGILYMFFFIIILGISTSFLPAYGHNNKWISIISFALFLVITIFSIWAAFISSNNIGARSLILVLVYFLIITIGSFTFGMFYLLNNLWKEEIINSFKNASALRILGLLIKYSLNNFYNFPTDKLFCMMGIIQYFVGKFLDLFLLGYLVNMINKIGQPEK